MNPLPLLAVSGLLVVLSLAIDVLPLSSLVAIAMHPFAALLASDHVAAQLLLGLSGTVLLLSSSPFTQQLLALSGFLAAWNELA